MFASNSVSQHGNQRTSARDKMPGNIATAEAGGVERRPRSAAGVSVNSPKARRGKEEAVGGTAVAAAKSNETAYLQQKLRDVLDRQVATDEQHQQNMIATRHLLRRMYDENAGLRNIIAAAEFRKRNQGVVSSPDDPASVTDAEVKILSNRIHLARRAYNRLQHQLNVERGVVQSETRKEREARQIIAASAGVLDHAALETALTGNNTIALRIQKIERQLNEVLAKQRVVAMITAGYRQHIHDLEEEQSEYDNHIKSLEKQYVDRHKDHLHLITLFQNAEYDYEKMVAQRTAFTQHVKKQRRLKEKLLVDRRSEVQQALLDTERRNRTLANLQIKAEEESQLLEDTEGLYQELLERVARQRDVDSLLASGGMSAEAVSSPHHRGSAAGDAENEEKLSAYHLAIQELLKETKAEGRHQLLPIFRAEIEQYEQLRDQVEQKRQRQERLRDEVKRLRQKYEDARVSASTACGSHTSVVLEEELRTFLKETEKELQETVAEEESRRLKLRDLAMQGNRVAHLLSAYRPEVVIRPMRETDPHLPIHFTALTQKLLSLADEATRGAGAGGLAPPAAAVPVLLPENNVRVPIRKYSTADESGVRDKLKSDGSAQKMGPTGGYMQQRRPPSAESSLLDDSFELTRDAEHGTTQPPVVTSDLDDEDGDRSTSSETSQDASGGYGSFNVPGAASSSVLSKLPPRGPSGGRPASAQVKKGGAGGRRSGSAKNGRGSSVISDEPLQRLELKSVSMSIKERERKRLLNEERRRASLAKD